MLIMSLHYFQDELTGILKKKDIATNPIYIFCLQAHIALGIVAIFLGPTQFMDKIRNRYVNLHRAMGYFYLMSVMLSSIVGIIVAQFAMGGIISRIGFSVLAVFWMTSAIIALQSARKLKFIKHKKWMYISYGLTFAAITQRTLLLVPLIFSIKFMLIYKLSAWLPWILNTILAIYLFRKSEQKKIGLAERSA